MKNQNSVIQQTRIYTSKFRRIFFNEKGWKFIIFAGIISLIVSWIAGSKMFTGDIIEQYKNTKSGFFTMTSACIWVGIFNSIQNICKEHEILKSDYRSGMHIRSYVFAHLIWQFVVCLIQAIFMFIIFIIFIADNMPYDGVAMTAAIEYFITMFLMIYGSDILGIFVSTLSGTPNTAMTIMPFVLILQLIMSGVLFDLSGVSQCIAYITFSKWGMSAFGATSDLNNLPGCTESMSCYDKTLENILMSWIIMIFLSTLFSAGSIIILKIKNRGA